MMPLTRNLAGRVIVSVIVAFVVFFCLTVAMEGPAWLWGTEQWQDLLVLSFLLGIPGGVLWRRATGW